MATSDLQWFNDLYNLPTGFQNAAPLTMPVTRQNPMYTAAPLSMPVTGSMPSAMTIDQYRQAGIGGYGGGFGGAGAVVTTVPAYQSPAGTKPYAAYTQRQSTGVPAGCKRRSNSAALGG